MGQGLHMGEIVLKKNFLIQIISTTVVDYFSPCVVGSGKPEPRPDAAFATETSRRCARSWADAATAIATITCARPARSAGSVLPRLPGLSAQLSAVFLADGDSVAWTHNTVR